MSKEDNTRKNTSFNLYTHKIYFAFVIFPQMDNTFNIERHKLHKQRNKNSIKKY